MIVAEMDPFFLVALDVALQWTADIAPEVLGRNYNKACGELKGPHEKLVVLHCTVPIRTRALATSAAFQTGDETNPPR